MRLGNDRDKRVNMPPIASPRAENTTESGEAKRESLLC